MAYVTSEHAVRPPLLSGLAIRLGALRDQIAANRRKREIYLRTLRELESYSLRELNDLKLDPADFKSVARQSAGLPA